METYACTRTSDSILNHKSPLPRSKDRSESESSLDAICVVPTLALKIDLQFQVESFRIRNFISKIERANHGYRIR